MLRVTPTESHRSYLQPKDGMRTFGADRVNHILDLKDQPG